MHLTALITGFLLALASCAPVYAGMSIASGGQGTHTHSDANTGGGTLALSGSLTSTKACATGFTRTAPNYCKRSSFSYGATISRTSGVGCTATASLGVSDVQMVDLFGQLVLTSAAAVNLKSNTVGFWNTGCTVLVGEAVAEIREMASTATGTQLLKATLWSRIPVNSDGSFSYTVTFSNMGANASSEFTIMGYVD